MNSLRYHASLFLFRLATRIYPLRTGAVGQAQYVGQRWLDWKLESYDFQLRRVFNVNR